MTGQDQIEPRAATEPPHSKKRCVVGIGGTFRQRSTSEMLVRAVLQQCEALGARTIMIAGPELAKLPHYNPDDEARTREQSQLVDAVRQADALVIGSPGYHGSVSGLIKNALDLLDDTRGDARCYFDGVPVGLIVAAAGWQAGGVTLAAMRGIVHAMRGWPTSAGININSLEQKPFDADGKLTDPVVGNAIALQARQLMSFRLSPIG